MPPTAPATASPATTADQARVLDALALAGCEKSRVWLTQFIGHLGWRRSDGAPFDVATVGDALSALQAQGRVLLQASGRHDLPAADRAAAWPRLLDLPELPRAWVAWCLASAQRPSFHTDPPPPPFASEAEAAALARLALVGGLDVESWQRISTRTLGAAGQGAALAEAATAPFLPAAWARMDATLREMLLLLLMQHEPLEGPRWAPLVAWLDAQLAQAPQALSPALRLPLAEQRLHRGDLAGCDAALAGLSGPGAELIRAGALAWRGRWAEAEAAFAAAGKTVAKLAGVRRGYAPERLLQLHLLALMLQPEAKAWAAARKLAVAESGSRQPPADDPWGRWAHAIAVRLGEATLQAGVVDAPPPTRRPLVQEDDAHRLILAAWLGEPSRGWNPTQLGQLVALLRGLGLFWKADLVRQACERLDLRLAARGPTEGTPWPVQAFAPKQAAWREALGALLLLGEGSSGTATEAAPALLQWRLTLDSVGRVEAVQAFEQTVGVRGPGKPKAVPLSRIKKAERLDPRDAAVARCIAPQRWHPGLMGLDVAAAAVALVGHPQVAFDDHPQQWVDLREALPTLEVQRLAANASEGERYALRLLDAVASTVPPRVGEDFTASDPSAEAERRNSVRIVRDAPERARLLRIGAPQRRIAELVGKPWTVPASAEGELRAVLRVLAQHCQLHTDLPLGETVAAEARLRAQLSPQGDGLRLRLLVQPFGLHGPALLPGRGQARVHTVQQGRHWGTERRLDEEAAHLAAVLEALPFLQGGAAEDSSWVLDDPEQALAAVERLPRLPAVAGVDWPRGKAVRVHRVDREALQARVQRAAEAAGNDEADDGSGGHGTWFTLQGDLRVDAERVLGLQQLLRLLDGAGRSRYVALGDGEYLALGEQLRQQLADLRALARPQAGSQALQLPAAAAGWLGETLGEQAGSRGDEAWRAQLQRLDEAAALQPVVPTGLQAELRPYQVDGYAWMARLAHAGLGACLADDMGLGKTVQTLALLLQRAAEGPALVLAPTSVCGNWVAEARQFAPSLRVRLYGEADAAGDAGRQALLATLGPGDVLVASYGLAQIDDEAFAAHAWATLVLDEAQALKNAATKRARAVAQLQAGFRLALSGTPVENRLADLWSLMNILNPGLLGSPTQFGERFVGPIEREHDPAAQARLKRLVSPFLLRRTKAQVLQDLPPRTEIVLRVEPGDEERAFLEATRREAVQRVEALALPDGDGDGEATGTEGTQAFHVLAELTRLRRAACDPRLVAPQLGLVGAKLQAFVDLAQELVEGRHKALVFSQFTDFLDLLAGALRERGLSFQHLDGSTPAAERTRRVAAFQGGEGDLFLISLKAGGFGLNLTAADYVFIVDPWWNPAAEDQALGRAHRMGQQRPVTVYRLVTAGSVEERILDLHRDKRALADGLLEGQDRAVALDAASLKALLASRNEPDTTS